MAFEAFIYFQKQTLDSDRESQFFCFIDFREFQKQYFSLFFVSTQE